MALVRLLCSWGMGTAFVLSLTASVRGQTSTPLDPAAWGEDHVGKSFPNYMTSGECLFCHRDGLGGTWQSNRHNLTLRVALPEAPALEALRSNAGLKALAEDVTHLLGGDHRVRYLKPNGRYGQLAILSTQWAPGAHLLVREDPQWDDDLFARSCVGCHATAVDSKLRAFSSPAVDCFPCHGDVPPAHEEDTDLVYFSGSRPVEPQVEISICGQCHLRGGTSKTSGLPYANTFLPGDNLFRDFAVDFSERYLAELDPGDRHVYQNARSVVVYGREEVTCATCHDVHRSSSTKHRSLRLLRPEDCLVCHQSVDDLSQIVPYQPRSEVCRYSASSP